MNQRELLDQFDECTSEIFDSKNASWTLPMYHSNRFHVWWDAEKYDYSNSYFLAKYCHEYFNVWWNPDKYNWRDSWALAQFCSEHFETWWNLIDSIGKME